MAFGLKTWLGVAVAGCALVAAAYLPSVGGEPHSYGPDRVLGVDSFYIDAEANPEYQALAVEHLKTRRTLGNARSYLQLMQRRDSLQRPAGASDLKGAEGPILWGTHDSQPWVIAAVQTLLDSIQNVPPGSPAIPAVVVVDAPVMYGVRSGVLSDPMSRRWYGHGAYALGYIVPQEDEHACFTSIALDVHGNVDGPELAKSLMRSFNHDNSSLLGPCAYYMAHGNPGPHVGAWLENVDYSFAQSPGWLGEPQNLGWPRSYRPWSGWYQYELAGYWHLVRCASGDRSSCLDATRRGRQAVQMPSPWWSASKRPRGVVLLDHGWVRYRNALGPRQPSYLSDLLLDQGHYRFRRFWTSDKELEVAFQDAFDVPIEDWTMQWARSQIGVPRRGPSAPRGSVVLSLMVGLVLVGGGGVYASRREVS